MGINGKPITTGERHAGVEIRYDHRHHLVTLSGWYDTYVGIQPETITLTRLLFTLGITVGDCKQAWADITTAPCANCQAVEWVKFDGEASTCIDEPTCIARVARANAAAMPTDECGEDDEL